MFERFSAAAREVVTGAQQEARALGHERIGTEHLVLAALRHPRQPGTTTLRGLGVTTEACRTAVAAVVTGRDAALDAEDARALRSLGVDLEAVRGRAEEAFGPGALDSPQAPAPAPSTRRRTPFGRRRGRGSGPATLPRHLPFTAGAKKALELSLRECLARKDRRIGVEHLVLGLLRCADRTSLALFERLGVDPAATHARVLDELRHTA